MIVFRTDSNADIGEGHIMRCIAIAKELQRRGEKAVFITADEYSSRLLAQENLVNIVLGTDWKHMNEETAVLLPLLKKIKTDCILVDSYSATPEYFKNIKSEVKTAYMDDFGLQTYPVDIVVNYNVYCDSIPYELMYENSNALCLLGPKYIPLREEFCSLQPGIISDRVNNIMITTGSSDPYDISGRLVRRMVLDRCFNGSKIHIVAGRYYTNTAELKAISRAYPQVIVHENVQSISAIMRSCDIAVSASGTTVYELCACGIPSILFSFVDNQTLIREYFGNCGAMVDCGDLRFYGEECIENIIKASKTLANKERRIRLSTHVRSITDGCGAERLASYLTGDT